MVGVMRLVGVVDMAVLLLLPLPLELGKTNAWGCNALRFPEKNDVDGLDPVGMMFCGLVLVPRAKPELIVGGPNWALSECGWCCCCGCCGCNCCLVGWIPNEKPLERRELVGVLPDESRIAVDGGPDVA